jgi:hypothetical protein
MVSCSLVVLSAEPSPPTANLGEDSKSASLPLLLRDLYQPAPLTASHLLSAVTKHAKAKLHHKERHRAKRRESERERKKARDRSLAALTWVHVVAPKARWIYFRGRFKCVRGMHRGTTAGGGSGSSSGGSGYAT